MTLVLAGTTGGNPAELYPDKYKNCSWNYVTGWRCELVENPVTVSDSAGMPNNPVNTTQSLTPDPSVLPNAGSGKCCGCRSSSAAMGNMQQTATVVGSDVSVIAESIAPCGCNKYTTREIILSLVLAVVLGLIFSHD